MNFIKKSIKTKIALTASIVLIIVALANIINTSYSTKDYAVKNAEQTAKLEAEKFAGMFKTKIDDALTLSRTLATVFSSVKSEQNSVNLNREEANTIVRELAENNSNIIGAFVAWVPDNSFDGRDAEYAGRKDGCPTGRFNTYYTWGKGAVTRQPETPWDYEQTAEYFTKPRDLGKECVIDPYLYPVDGVDVLMVSLPSPIKVKERFYGVASIDISVSFIQQIANSANLYNKTGVVSIISSNGTIAGITGKDKLAGKMLDSVGDLYKIKELKQKVAKGESYSAIVDNTIQVLVPVKLGRADSP